MHPIKTVQTGFKIQKSVGMSRQKNVARGINPAGRTETTSKINFDEGNLFQISAFGAEVFKVNSVNGNFVFANIVGVVANGEYNDYNKPTIREKKKTYPEYFDTRTNNLEAFEIESGREKILNSGASLKETAIEFDKSRESPSVDAQSTSVVITMPEAGPGVVHTAAWAVHGNAVSHETVAKTNDTDANCSLILTETSAFSVVHMAELTAAGVGGHPAGGGNDIAEIPNAEETTDLTVIRASQLIADSLDNGVQETVSSVNETTPAVSAFSVAGASATVAAIPELEYVTGDGDGKKHSEPSAATITPAAYVNEFVAESAQSVDENSASRAAESNAASTSDHASDFALGKKVPPEPELSNASSSGPAAVGIATKIPVPATAPSVTHTRHVTKSDELWPSKATVLPSPVQSKGRSAPTTIVYAHEQTSPLGPSLGSVFVLSRGVIAASLNTEMRLASAHSFNQYEFIDGIKRVVFGFAYLPNKSGLRPRVLALAEGMSDGEISGYHVGALTEDLGKSSPPLMNRALQCVLRFNLYQAGKYPEISIVYEPLQRQAQGRRLSKPLISLLQENSEVLLQKQAEKQSLDIARKELEAREAEAARKKAIEKLKREQEHQQASEAARTKTEKLKREQEQQAADEAAREKAEKRKREREQEIHDAEAARKKEAKERSELASKAARESREEQRQRRVSDPLPIRSADASQGPGPSLRGSEMVLYQPQGSTQSSIAPTYAAPALASALIPTVVNSDLADIRNMLGSLASQLQHQQQQMLAGQQQMQQQLMQQAPQIGNPQHTMMSTQQMQQQLMQQAPQIGNPQHTMMSGGPSAYFQQQYPQSYRPSNCFAFGSGSADFQQAVRGIHSLGSHSQTFPPYETPICGPGYPSIHPGLQAGFPGTIAMGMNSQFTDIGPPPGLGPFLGHGHAMQVGIAQAATLATGSVEYDSERKAHKKRKHKKEKDKKKKKEKKKKTTKQKKQNKKKKSSHEKVAASNDSPGSDTSESDEESSETGSSE